MKQSSQQSQGLLLFKLTEKQTFALGTLKVREIIPYQHLTILPHSHRAVVGSTPFRGKTIPIIDMAAAVGYRAIQKEEIKSCFIIVTDCQRQLVGFLVRKIDRIIECNWRNIHAAPAAVGRSAYVLGVTDYDKKMVQLIDIEMLLSHVFPTSEDHLHANIDAADRAKLREHRILVVDDSSVARRQLSEALDYANIPFEVCSDGSHALEVMIGSSDSDERFDILVSDIEMPGLDGYELTFEVRSNPKIANSYIILHTSLSSEISVDRAHQVGANEALTKFDANELVQGMLRGARHIENGTVTPGVAGY
ncbi:chemotaxis protein [Celerinatantimonas yamalensis]|uniref:Chemotaxis protein n=1 Tax=Celerinatantimonas yamalensis TaxID=559956 RepID=A0ABW9G3K4_9GAMM